MRKLVSAIASVALLLAVSAGPAVADDRCAGRAGIQFWEHSNKGGATIRFCWKGGTTITTLYASNMGNYTTNLNFGANWNDRASSLETFNMTGHTIRLYADAGYSSASVGGRVVDISGNEYVSYLGNFWSAALPSGFNDLVSSWKAIK